MQPDKFVRLSYMVGYKRQALFYAYEGRRDRLVWNLSVVAGIRFIK